VAEVISGRRGGGERGGLKRRGAGQATLEPAYYASSWKRPNFTGQLTRGFARHLRARFIAPPFLCRRQSDSLLKAERVASPGHSSSHLQRHLTAPALSHSVKHIDAHRLVPTNCGRARQQNCVRSS
jgi:hypothetical protein